jgi:hypothetical protein
MLRTGHQLALLILLLAAGSEAVAQSPPPAASKPAAPTPGGKAPTANQHVMRIPPVQPGRPQRRPIVLGLPRAQTNAAGDLTDVRPDVHYAEAAPKSEVAANMPGMATAWTDDPQYGRPVFRRMWDSPGATPVRAQGPAPETLTLPPPVPPSGAELLPPSAPGEIIYEGDPSMMGEYGPVADPWADHPDCGPLRQFGCPHCSPIEQWFGEDTQAADAGLGQERVMLAPFEIDVTQPFNNLRMRVDCAYNLTQPDRAEFYWARPKSLGGLGPNSPERSVDYQDVRFQLEVGGPKFSVATEAPIRILDPDINPNTAGFGDMTLTTKLLMVDGSRWQITQYFRTYFNTGFAPRGLGTGHISIEPGFLARFKWSERTYFHGEAKFWVPTPGHLEQAGEVLRFGIGVSHVWFETDSFAAMPTLEFVGWSVLDGMETAYPSGASVEVDPEGIFNVYPGIRFVRDADSELGLAEFGISGGAAVTTNQWYESLLRVEARFSF